MENDFLGVGKAAEAAIPAFSPHVFLTEVHDSYYIGTTTFGDKFLAACAVPAERPPES